MPFDSMSAWDRHTFEFADSIQQRGGSWSGKFSFDEGPGRTISRDDYVPPSPPPSAEEAPRFTDATLSWSPPSSPGTRSPRTSQSGSPTRNPRVDSAKSFDDSPPASPLSTKEKRSLADKLYAASCAGDVQHISLLLSLGAPINTPSLVPGLYDAFKPPKPGYLSALAGAAGNGQLDACELLLAHGASINPSMKESSSAPLHQACKADDVEIARFLLEVGADVDALNCYKTTPMMYATKYGSPELVSILLSFKPDLHIQSFFNTSAIHWAVWPNNPPLMEQLLQAGAHPNDAMGEGSTPLHCAAGAGFREVVQVLLKYGADPKRRNEEWKLASQLAAEAGYEEIAELLQDAEKRKCTKRSQDVRKLRNA